MSQRSQKPKTRAQRRALAVAVCAFMLSSIPLLLWMPSGEAPGPESPNSLGSSHITTYGMLGYLQTETVIHLSPATDVPVARITHSTTHNWHWLRLGATIVLTGLAIGAIVFVYRYQMSVGVVPGYCRNCAYPLTGLDTSRCPECGEENEF